MKNLLKSISMTTLIAVSMSNAAFAQFTPNQELGSSSPSSGPSLSQLGSTTAYIPMKHDSFPCGSGNECGKHVLATTKGNLNIKFKIGMTCPTGRKVTHLSYQPQGQNANTLINSNTNSQSYSKTITMQPFSLKDLEKAGQEAFGGGWVYPNTHNNKTKTVKKTLKTSIDVWGQCSGWANKQKKTFPVTVTATFEDKSFIVPVP
ncbi:MAG: hypothetical protein KME23_18145 [Goleter apudmare HA4340-LM2]|nr:hypothetical protein [Goleter apudmare HA4340-LM2]